MPKLTMTRRFYKTQSAVNAPHIKGTYTEAVAQAKQDIADGKADEVNIVEIVAVVKREVPVPPITVIEVRRD